MKYEPFLCAGVGTFICCSEECSPHISEHCVQQMSCFLLLLQVLVSPLGTGLGPCLDGLLE